MSTKVVNIELHIGRCPSIAVGNSDGDLAMMQYTTDGSDVRMALLLIISLVQPLQYPAPFLKELFNG